MTLSTHNANNDSRSGAPRAAQPRPHAEILDLASSCTTRHGFMAKVVARIGARVDSPYAAVHVAYGSETIHEVDHRGASNPRFWSPPVQEFLTDVLSEEKPRAKLLSNKDASIKIALIAAPIINDALGLHGAVAAVVSGGEQEARRKLAVLTTMADVASVAVGWVARTAKAESRAASSDGAGRALARAATVSSPEELAFALTNSLRNKLGCEQVILGLVARRRIKILSISGHDDINRRSPGVAKIRAAMEECYDYDQPIVSQYGQDWEDHKLASNHRLHQSWQGAAGGACVASIPLHMDDRCIAVLSLRRRPDEPFRKDLIDDIRTTVEPFAPALLLVKRAKRSLMRHAWDAAGDFLASLVKPDRIVARVFAVAAFLSVLWFCFGSLDYEIVVPARVVPAVQRQIAAPRDARLVEVAHAAGDVVKAGEILCRFDQRDLLLQQSQLLAQLSVYDFEHLRAQAQEEPVEARLVDAKRKLTSAQLDIVQRRLDDSVLRAPFDGVVISGDLRKMVGGVLAQGAPLFDVAPLDEWSIEMDVPQAVSGEIHAGLPGMFAGHARPEDGQPFELTRVRPSAEIRKAENVFVAEAGVAVSADWIRPGMEGVAKVDVGQRKVWWIALHKVLDYLRLNFWL